MFGEWLRFWQRWMFWWLPDDKTSGDARTDREFAPRSAAAKPDAEATDVNTAAPWQPPEPGAETTPKTPPDDLTAIKGIGPGIVRKLDALGIKTFADLAKADPDDLASKLALRPVTPTRMREWIAEATKRTGSS